MWDILLDAFLDTLKIFPFLLVIYILIELLENKTSFTRNHALLQGKLAPLLGTATGLIPQCGFSVMAAKLYDKGLIRTGTLLAVFIATSDEAFIILLSSGAVNPQAAASLMPMVLIKLVVGLSVGYLVNFLLSNEKLAELPDEEEVHAYSCGREHEGHSKLDVYLWEPLLHSLKISLYLFLVNLIFGFLIDAVGQETISSYMIGGPWFQPFITALIGLIPNCASSVLITQAYVNNGILFGSCVAGLCSNAGLGFVVLLKNTKKLKRNILLILATYLIAAATGVVVNGVMLAFHLI
jgi:hypothetical protein